ncbi:unnamed protein product [Pocillopora meandrina]|uniref:Uncharacterized protein n=1 Tax=Pocillopora meandrina TaxID=46732 RepID=A0AAU9Y4G6_9CNID|nr:unnamed protein product [Pocillopora meandrina]
MDFSDAQGRKGPCDRKAAKIKSHIAVYLNSGHDIETASQMLEAISSFDGVAGVQAMICSPPTSPLRTSINSSDNSVKVNFVPIKPRRIKKPTADLKDDQNDGKDDDDNDIDDDCDNDDDATTTTTMARV